jgi:hypothetical protein
VFEARVHFADAVWTYIARGDDWCKGNREEIAAMAMRAAEEVLLNYWTAWKALDQARRADGLPRGRPRAEHFVRQVRFLRERRKELERTGR